MRSEVRSVRVSPYYHLLEANRRMMAAVAAVMVKMAMCTINVEVMMQ
jgi:hypothetical protein